MEKTPEQIEAELKMEADIKKALAEQYDEKVKAAGDVHFVKDGKVYIPLLQSVIVPGCGLRSALELCADEEAQDYLINTEGCLDTVIKEL